MQKYGLNELREMYLSFFESKGHLRMPSFPLVPQNDPSVLLINAGMTPLKPYFTGRETPPRNRMTTCQKCIRTPDIENVGKTARHGTFFEMLGNFSFGDYFKEDAIPWAWEFMTVTMGIPANLLYVSVYQDDDEAYNIWHHKVGLSESKIFRMGKADNFWEHGTGPCGPCSEIYFDRGPEKGCGKPECTVGCDCDRFIEIWNNVFTQFDRQEDGTYLELASKNIDTGMGLERLACVMQGVDNIFEVDAIRSTLDHVCSVAKVAYGEVYKKDVSIRVITDHTRSTTMMISDGILPSNEGRGYVLRRLLRRAARHGRLLGVNRVFLAEVADTVIKHFGEAYPNLKEKGDYIKRVITIEEEKFYQTVDAGMSILEGHMADARKAGQTVLSGEVVFKLHDTYGFPLDLTREIVDENGMQVDEAGFQMEMKKQKDAARDAHKRKEGSAWEKDVFAGKTIPATEFVGYDTLSKEATVLALVAGGEAVDGIQQDDEVTIVLDSTPFYAESGGQAGDVGCITMGDAVVDIQDTRKTTDGRYLHTGVVRTGAIQVGDKVLATVDADTRKATARNHTVTHLLHKALKEVLGDHVAQAGSMVTPERLRFDFTHFSAITAEQLADIENRVNKQILADGKVSTQVLDVEEARKTGAMALFGEKYGSHVRVVSVADYSRELCGGTHLEAAGEAGLVKILGENGIASGVRRIEAVTGLNALRYYQEREMLLKDISGAVKTNPEDAVRRIDALNDELKQLKKEMEQLNAKMVSSSTDSLIGSAPVVKGVKILAADLPGLDMNALRSAADSLKAKLEKGVVILTSAKDDKVNLIVSATKAAVEAGIHSGNIVRDAAKAIGGGGGGRPDMAQAGGKDAAGIPVALETGLKLAMGQLG